MLTPINKSRFIFNVTQNATLLADAALHSKQTEQDTADLEAALVTAGVMLLSHFAPQPRYILMDRGWVYYVLARHSNIVFPTADAVLKKIPEGVFAGNDSTVFNALNDLVNAGLVTYTQGAGWTYAT